MPDTAESLMQSITTNRSCVIEIKNDSMTYWLYNPKVHMESGYSFSPPTPTLRSTLTEVCAFTKDDNTASGAVGVLTYDLFNIHNRQCTEMIAIMFSVPFDYNFYANWLGVGIFENTRECDHKLFDHMYKEDEITFVRYKADGSGLAYRSNTVDIRACMSDEGNAIVKLELYDSMGL